MNKINGDVGMHHAQNSGNKKFPDTICRKGLHMIVLVSLIVLLMELLASTIFLMVHPYLSIHSVE